MRIQDMFVENIKRDINGVIKVDQEEANVIEQEVREYVITKELKKHFINFFEYYVGALDSPTADIGVWISGFFGSGKSHFLKMLSYILENKSINGVPTVELFRKKFADDPKTFNLIDRASRGKTETILFDIDIEGPINKDKTAVLRVFAKMFYNHLGFCGNSLKIAMLEQYIDQLGKTEEFRRVFEQKKGKSWVSQRKSYAFNRGFLVPTLMEVLGLSEEDARKWFDDKTEVEFSIAQLVEDIKAYVKDKPSDYRLLFMIDEVGQYVGTDTNMLLNLQSLIEKIGVECGGKVWIVCTGQEAIDEIIKVRADEFSRIQARFKKRLSLSSSSVDEVIQKRILEKTEEAQNQLAQVYQANDSVLKNLFSFQESVLDIKGYTGEKQFIADFPFVPYQFIVMQNILNELRKHGSAGKHSSGAERNMLSCFQKAGQAVIDGDEYTLVPFFRFYDPIHEVLDSSVRQVIERCLRAADDGNGIEYQDVDVLKLLFLIRHANDIKPDLDNIVILMADDIRLDKITMREQVRGSLDRLISQNYIGRTGDTYHFLTDEEQDIQIAIRNTPVPAAEIVGEIASHIFDNIYTTKKHPHGRYNFAFDRMVDGQVYGTLSGEMLLNVLTVASDPEKKQELQLLSDSVGKAIVVLAENNYYESLENAMKIRKYVMQRSDINLLPKSVQNIIHDQQNEANNYEKSAIEDLKKAIGEAQFYVDGEHIEVKSGDAKSKLDQTLEYLVSRVYSELDLITVFAETDADIYAILRGDETVIPGMEPNRDAAAKVEKYLEIQNNQNRSTTMYDVQDRFQKKPFGWREIDIAAVVAQLVYQQKVTIKYGGETIRSGDDKLPDMLRKKSEIGKTSVSKRISPPVQKMREARDFLRDYFNEMDVPEDEDGLIAYIVAKFNGLLAHYIALDNRYEGHKYPDRVKVRNAVALVKEVLSQQKDNMALIDCVIDREDQLYQMHDELQDIEDFFKTRVGLFDAAAQYERDLSVDRDYIEKNNEAHQALNQIRLITLVPAGEKFLYARIPLLNDLLTQVKAAHGAMLDAKREELLEIVRQCMEEIHTLAGENPDAKRISDRADAFFDKKKEDIASYQTLTLLDGLIPQMWQYKDDTVERIETVLHPSVTPPIPPKSDDGNTPPVPPKEVIKTIHRQAMFPARTLKTEEEIDVYVERIRANMKLLLKGCDGIKLN